MKSIKRIVLIGAGNVGWHLGHALFEAGIEIIQVFSRSEKKSIALAQKLDSNPINDLKQVIRSADLYLLAVSDNAIAKVAQELKAILSENALLCHTSGATPAIVLGESRKRFGVFYPLQTFSLGRPVDFSNIPICVDAALAADQAILLELANKLSSVTYQLSDQDRAILHVTAVFANNFSNHLFAIANDILSQHQLPFDLLKALISETAAKVQVADPKAMQTGPAIRKDDRTIQRHLNLLQDFPQYQQLYQLLSSSIQNQNS